MVMKNNNQYRCMYLIIFQAHTLINFKYAPKRNNVIHVYMLCMSFKTIVLTMQIKKYFMLKHK